MGECRPVDISHGRAALLGVFSNPEAVWFGVGAERGYSDICS